MLFSFQTSNPFGPYRLYSHADYVQLPVRTISSLSRTTRACQTGPDVGLIDLAGQQSENLFRTIEIAGQNNWQMPNEQFAYGISTSLYDHDPLTGKTNGQCHSSDR
jgi:hypothetical protein